jgi:hypothetical protein
MSPNASVSVSCAEAVLRPATSPSVVLVSCDWVKLGPATSPLVVLVEFRTTASLVCRKMRGRNVASVRTVEPAIFAVEAV